MSIKPVRSLMAQWYNPKRLEYIHHLLDGNLQLHKSHCTISTENVSLCFPLELALPLIKHLTVSVHMKGKVPNYADFSDGQLHQAVEIKEK